MNALSFIIEAKDKATATLGKLKSTFTELRNDWQKAMSGMKEGSYSGLLSFGMKILPMIGAASLAFKAFGASLRWVSEGIQEAARFEKFTDQLARVTGSVKLARAELKALTEGGFAVDDLFDEADIVAAAIALKKLSNGILGTAGDMHTIAEAATATNQSMLEVSQSVGMVISKLLAGDTYWSRFATQMVKSGTLSMQTVVAMQKMQTEGRAAGDIISYMWASLNGANAGAIDDARKGIEGLSKAVDDARSDAKRAWGEFFAPIQKGIDHARIAWFRFVEDLSKKPSGWMGAMGPVGSTIGHIIEGQMGKNQTPSVEENKTGSAAIKAKAKEAAAKMGMSPDDFEKQWKEKEDAEKKAAEDAAKTHEEVLKKKADAQAKYDEARRTKAEQLAALEKNRTNLEQTIGIGDKGSDARLEAEAEILNIDTEILKIKKEISDEEAKAASEAAAAAREKANAEDSARKERKVAESQYKYHAAYDKASPEQQMAITEANIKRWQKRIAEAGDEEAKGKATEGLIGQLKERDRISKEMADKETERKEKLTSLADRDRELRETGMTADERIAASKQRAAELEKSLAAETDPDKKIKIQEQMMSEAEKQQALAAQKTGPRSMDMGDVFEKGYNGQLGKKDLAAKQVEISQDIKRLLEKIEAKEGGMTP